MGDFLYTIEIKKENPTLSDIASLLGISEDMISKDFGVVPLEPEKGTYCILLSQKAFSSIKDKNIGTAYSNPKIEPFGLEEE